ncbi:MAG TPA: cupin domain-containing protein [bacterium]|nr:cupin domain-containing protein [bacterium]
MTEQVTRIAKRLRELRENNDLSPEWAVKALGVTLDELSSYESGEVDIPVSFLYMAAKKYGVELSTLLTGENPREHMYAVVRKGEGVGVERSRAYQYSSLCAAFAHKKMEPLLVTVEPKPDETQKHFNTHDGQEFHYVLEGVLRVTIREDEIELQSGDSLIFNSEHPHALEAVGADSARVLVVIG